VPNWAGGTMERDILGKATAYFAKGRSEYAFIERHRAAWPICVQCRVLGVSVSGFIKILPGGGDCWSAAFE